MRGKKVGRPAAINDRHAPAWAIVPTTGLSGLAAREDTWRQRLELAPTDGLFLEPEWVFPWLAAFQAMPRALIASQGGQARALAILVGARLFPWDRAPIVLRPPGLGVSDYLDFVLPPDLSTAREAVGRLLDWLVQAGDWDLLDLPNLPSESPTASLLAAAAAERRLPGLRIATYARPYIELSGTWDCFLASRTGKLRYNLRARRRQLGALGELGIRHYTAPEDLRPQLQRAVEVHTRRWEGQHTSTTFSASARARRFYAEAALGMAERGWLDLSSLELDGEMIAFCLGFVRGSRYYYYLPAFEPRYARYGPSAMLLAHLIERAYALGLREFDFMLGDEPYKEQWATGVRTTTRLVVGAPGVRGRTALAVFRAYLQTRERARRSPVLQKVRRHGIRGLKSQAARLADHLVR